MAKRLMCIVLSFLMIMTVLPTGVVAETDFSGYTEITASGGALTTGNYYLTSNVTLTNDITIAYGETVVIDLNGCTLTGTGNSSVITVYGSLTLNDSGGTGVITGGYAQYGGGVYVYSAGVDYPATFTMNGGTISGNTAYYHGGGVAVWSVDTDTVNTATFTMNGGSITSNHATRTNGQACGGGVHVYDGNLIINDGSITNNTATGSSTGGGGGVSVWEGTLTMNGGTISGNSASSSSSSNYGYGGGVYVYTNESGIPSTFTFNNGTISNNTADYAGGIYANAKAGCSVTITMYDGTISGNTASTNAGGGVVLNSYYVTFYMNGGSIINNTAKSYGGGVRTTGTFVMSGGTISGNSAAFGGGVGINYSTYGNGVFTMSGGTISDNTASSWGGGVYAYTTITSGATMFNMTGGTITSNSATGADGSGGGVFLDGYSPISMSGGAIYGNTATYCGADIRLYSSNSSATLINANEMTSGDYDFTGYYWYNDALGSRFNAETNVTDKVDVSITISGPLYIVAGRVTVYPSFYGKNILLGGTIGVKFYVDCTDVPSYTSYSVKFTFNNNTTTVSLADATLYQDSIYYVTLDVPCWLMGSTITAQIYNGETAVGDAIEYSVATYVTNVSSSSTPKMQSLLTYMLNFGYYAEDYYNYVNSASITSLDDSVKQSLDSVTTDVLSAYNVSATVSDITVSAAVVLDKTCEIRVYVPTDDTYTVVIDGETRTEATGIDSTGTYYAISNILVQDWENGHSIVVKNSSGDVVYSVSGYNVLSYAYRVVNNSGSYDSSVVSLVKAMYLYNDAADRYLSNKS